MFQRQLKMALKIGNAFINEDDLIPVIVKASTEMIPMSKDIMFTKNIRANCELGIGSRNGT